MAFDYLHLMVQDFTASAFFLKGLLIGFSLAAPIGPVGMIIIFRTIRQGRIAAFTLGFAVALADSMFGMIAGFGLTAIASYLMVHMNWMKIIGGSFMIFLAIKAFSKKIAMMEEKESNNDLIKQVLSIFILVLTNPQTILVYIAMMAGLGLGTDNMNHFNASVVIAGVFTGSLCWWFLLTTITSLFKAKINLTRLKLVNTINGLLLSVVGAWAIISAMTSFYK